MTSSNSFVASMRQELCYSKFHWISKEYFINNHESIYPVSEHKKKRRYIGRCKKLLYCGIVESNGGQWMLHFPTRKNPEEEFQVLSILKDDFYWSDNLIYPHLPKNCLTFLDSRIHAFSVCMVNEASNTASTNGHNSIALLYFGVSLLQKTWGAWSPRRITFEDAKVLCLKATPNSLEKLCAIKAQKLQLVSWFQSKPLIPIHLTSKIEYKRELFFCEIFHQGMVLLSECQKYKMFIENNSLIVSTFENNSYIKRLDNIEFILTLDYSLVVGYPFYKIFNLTNPSQTHRAYNITLFVEGSNDCYFKFNWKRESQNVTCKWLNLDSFTNSSIINVI